MEVNRSTQRHVIGYNNYGVSLIESGNYDIAISALSKSLKTCRQIMDEADDFPAPIATCLDSCMEQSRAVGADFCRDRCDSQSEQYLYRQAIRIPMVVGSNYRACVLVSTIVTFNLALANQLASMGKLESETMLRKAVKLYELAFSMQQEENFDSNTLFTLATVNNLGLVHSRLNDRNAASKCFEYLLSTLMYLTDCSGNQTFEFDGFFRNASTLIHKPFSAAAA
jgi:tetratricopeptide (TPR) repeat protein